MQFDIQSRGFSLTTALLEHVRRRLRFELGWAGDHVSKVTVRLSDLNGPRGGADKRCQIRIAAPNAAVVVEDVEDDLYIAIDRAVGRAGRSLARRIARNREVRPRAAQKILGTDAAATRPAVGC